MSVPQRKAVARYLLSHYKVSQRRVCKLAKISSKALRYIPRRPPQDALRRRIVELAHSRVRYGYKRIHVLLKREGVHINRKRVHRLYCLEGLQLRAKRPKRNVSAATREPPKCPATVPNEAWSMDFVADQFVNGRRFRALTIVDVFTRECLAVEPGARLTSEDVVRVANRITKERGAPRRVYCDNGSEFAGHLFDLWAYGKHVQIQFSRPGKPTDNAFIESFNGSLRDECLNMHWFTDLTDASNKLQAWQEDYNESRPHRSLNNLTPSEFAAQWATEGQTVAK